MISSIKKLLCLLVLLSLCLGLFKKVIHNTDPEALCLDGSPAALLVHQGSQPKNILMYMMGLGSCAQRTLEESLDTCVRFTKTGFGSSTVLSDKVDEENYAIFSKIQKSKFAEWTKILLIECDGALFQGYNKNPAEHKGKKLYFRGGKIMRAHLKWIDQQYGLKQADKVVLIGQSGGGVAAYGWVDYIRGMVSDPKKFYGIIDSGIFLDPVNLVRFGQQSAQILPSFAPNALLAPTGGKKAGSIKIDESGAPQDKQPRNRADTSAILPEDSIKQFMKISNADERPPNANCLKTLNDKSEDWRCFFAPKATLHVQTKMLWLNSQYDSLAIKQILRIGCLQKTGPFSFTPKNCSPPELLLINFYRALINTHVLGELAKKGHSIWSNACSWHGIAADSEIYDNWRVKAPFYGRRRTAKQAVEDFVFKDQRIMDIDQFPWPSNRMCAF